MILIWITKNMHFNRNSQRRRRKGNFILFLSLLVLSKENRKEGKKRLSGRKNLMK
jgi:hypothetical protein